MQSRVLWVAIALSPVALVGASFFFDGRILGARLTWLGYATYALAGAISAVNFYLSFLRFPLHRWRTGSTADLHYVSGVPLLGDVAVLGLFLLPPSPLVSVGTLLLMLINTGSMFWFAVAVARESTDDAAA